MSLSENTTHLLQAVTDFASKAHGHQTRKYTPERYIVHPVKVMKLCSRYTDDAPTLAAALLHDVLEDTDTREEEMRAFLEGLLDPTQARRTLKIVKELTDEYTKTKYPTLNRKERKAKEHERLTTVSASAQTIKYADIIDNCLDIVDADRCFAQVFIYECQSLLNYMNDGHEVLHDKASDVIFACIQHLLRDSSVKKLQ